MKSLRILWVGDRKARVWEQTADHYRSLLGHHVDLRESAIKPTAHGPSSPERIAEEGKRILAALTPKEMLVCLDKGGKTHTSESFAAFLGSLLEDANRTPCFVIGGAFGLAPEVLAQSDHRLALGPMTFPHEMARVVLLEQLYRAMTIRKGFLIITSRLLNSSPAALLQAVQTLAYEKIRIGLELLLRLTGEAFEQPADV